MMSDPRKEGRPKVVADSATFAARSDASFFTAYPSLYHRLRPYIPGEFGHLDRHIDRILVDSVERTDHKQLLVAVTMIGPGVRTREPLFDLTALNALGATRN